MSISNYYTKPDDNGFAKKLSKTYPGQAHLAGEGKKGATCRECKHWDFEGYYASSNPRHGATLKPSSCMKYKFFTNKRGPKVPHTASVCKYFEGHVDTAKDTPKITDPASKGSA